MYEWIKKILTKIKDWIMANYATLKAAIANIIKTNGNEEITGEILQNALVAMINSLGAGYQFAGVAIPATTPGTPDNNVVYIAGAGTYPNFGATVVPKGSIGIFSYNGSWTYDTIDITDTLPAYININELANHPAAYADAATALADVPQLYRRTGVKVVYFDNTQQLWIEMLCIDDAGPNWWTDVVNNWIIEGPIETDMTTPTGGKQLRIGGDKKGNLDDVLNVNAWNEQATEYASQAAARAAVPANKRKLGAIITYLVSTGTDTSGWMIDEFIGSSISDWTVADNWKVVGPVSVSQNSETGDKIAEVIIGDKKTEIFSGLESQKTPIVTDSDADLDITDRMGNIIQRLKDGHLKTQKFDSTKAPKCDDATDDFSIEDNEHNRVFGVIDGYPRTAKFNGKEIAENVLNSAPLWSLAGKVNKGIRQSTFSSNSTITLSDVPAYVKNGSCINFACKIPSGSTWQSLIIGKGENTYSGVWYEITSTSIIIHYRTGAIGTETIYATIPHGLTFDTYIKLFIQFKVDATARVEIETLNGNYSNDNIFAYGFNHYGAPFAKVSGGNLTDVSFSYSSDKYKKPLWIFGDSYFGTIETRIFYYLIEWGICEDVMVDALPGITSTESLEDFEKCLTFGCPKTLVWMLGMNGPNSATIATINELKVICKNNNIELIINDVPTTPVVDNETLHTFVQNSGLRYVRSYEAVGTNANGIWYNGYLSSDNVHPTELGARAIAMQMIMDVPELMQFVTDRRN